MLPVPREHQINFVILGKPHEVIEELRMITALEKLGQGWLIKYKPQAIEVN